MRTLFTPPIAIVRWRKPNAPPGARADPNFQNRYRTKSGDYRWLRWRCEFDPDAGLFYCVIRDVTDEEFERRDLRTRLARQQDALLTAEQKLEVHVHATPLAVMELDPKLRVRRWSATAEALLGWGEEEVLGDRPDNWRFVHPDDLAGAAAALQDVLLGTRDSVHETFRNLTHDGRTVHCVWSCSAVFDVGGQLQSILAFGQDITARVEAEHAVADREHLFTATFEHAPIGLAFVGLDGRWLVANNTLCQLLGYSETELMGRRFQDVTHPDDLDDDRGNVQALLAGELERYAMLKRYIRKDGTLLWAKLTVSLRRNAEGRPLHFISIVEDVAAQIEAERVLRDQRAELEKAVEERAGELQFLNRNLAVEVEQRRRVETALRDSEERLRGVLENSHDAFIACDEAGNIVEWNRAAEALFGWRRVDALGEEIGELIVPPALRPAHDAGMARFLASGESRVLDQRLKLSAMHRNGKEFPVEMTITCIQVGARKLFTAFLHDISARVAANVQLRESEIRLRTITDNAPALIAQVGVDLRYVFANVAYRDWFGVDPQRLIGQSMREVLGAEGFGEIEAFARRALAGEQLSFERRQQVVGGAAKFAHVTYIPDRGGDPEARGVRGFYILAHDITDHKRLAEVMEERALQDELTGLPNRAGWGEQVRHALLRLQRTGTAAAVLFLDLDGFKQVNDTHGHEAGDAVLKAFARRLRDTLRPSDVVARLAGDEFVVLLVDLADGQADADAECVARKILKAMREPVAFGALRIPLTPSIGIATESGPDFDASTLLRRADEAMYRAKRSTGRQIVTAPA